VPAKILWQQTRKSFVTSLPVVPAFIPSSCLTMFVDFSAQLESETTNHHAHNFYNSWHLAGVLQAEAPANARPVVLFLWPRSLLLRSSNMACWKSSHQSRNVPFKHISNIPLMRNFPASRIWLPEGIENLISFSWSRVELNTWTPASFLLNWPNEDVPHRDEFSPSNITLQNAEP